jgi:hypothetical protein
MMTIRSYCYLIISVFLGSFVLYADEESSIDVNPSSLSFGTAQVGTNSSPQSYRLEAKANVNVSAPRGFQISLNSESGYEDFLSIPPRGGSVVATVYVRFSPTEARSYLDQITNTSSGASTQTVSVSGTGTSPPPQLSVVPSSLSFGNVQVGTNSSPQSYTITGSDLTANVAVAAPTGFQVSLNSGSGYGNSLSITPSNGSVNSTIYVRFSPSNAVSYSGSITNSSTGAETQSVSVSGTGTPPPPQLSVVPSSLSFGNVQVGTNSSPQSYTITGSDLTANVAVAAPTGFQVSLNSGSGYGNSLSITPSNGSVNSTIYVRFSPSNAQSYSGNITNSSTGAETQSVSVSGTGTPPPPQLSVVPSSLSFGNVQVGTNSSPQSYTITGSDLTANVAVAAPTGFQVSLNSGSGYGNSLSITPSNGSVNSTIYVRFSPSNAQSYSGNITNSSTGAETQSVSVSGTGTPPPPQLSVVPSSLSFGNVQVGTNSSPQSYTITGSDLTANVAVAAPTGFQVSLNSGSGYGNSLSITPSNGIVNSTIYVRFSPSNAVSYSGSITNSSTGATTRNVSVSGTGILSPPQLVSPQNGSTNVSTAPLLVWQSVNEADHYNLVLAKDISFSQQRLAVDNIENTSYQIASANSLNYSTTYYWQVQAANEAGTSNPSATWAFTTESDGVPTTLSEISGNGQSNQILSQLGNPFVVRVTDGSGNPVEGVPVNFSIVNAPSGANGQSLSTTNASTNAQGEASSTLTLGDKVGTYTVHATSLELSGSPVVFTATATTGSAANLTLVSGNNQSNQILSQLANPFIVRVTDAGGNPVQGVSVNFAIQSVPNGATGQSLSTTNTTTNAQGEASSTLTLGNRTGDYTVHATSSGLTGSPVVFTATATTGPAANITLVSGNNQSNQILSQLANPFVVRVTDAGGNPVQGVSVNFSIQDVPNGATGQSLSTTNTTTNAQGEASSTLTLGNRTGDYTVHATSSGLSGSPVVFTATATTGSAANIALVSGNNQSKPINSQLDNPFVVRVTDAGGNPVQGVSVNFAIQSVPNGATGQSLSTTNTSTNAQGEASSTLTLGNRTGDYTVHATSSGLSGSPVVCTATATTGPAANITLVSGNNQSKPINSQLDNPFVVRVTDAGGNPVQGVSVNFSIQDVPNGATGQSLSTTNTTTNAQGEASSTLTLGNRTGDYTVHATSSGLTGSPVVFTATATTGPAANITLVSGNNQSNQILSQLANPFVVRVTDAGGNPVQGVSVNFSIQDVPNGATGQSLSTTNTSTNAQGEASSTLTLGNRTGDYTVHATSSGLSGSPVVFTATATTGSAANIALVSGNNQSKPINSQLDNPFVVRVTDAGGNPVQGVSVNFSIQDVPNGATGQSLSTTNTSTNAQGEASSTLTLGNRTGDYTVHATSSGLTGSPVVFTATATTGPAANITLVSGNNQSNQILSQLANPFVVRVTDAGGNPVQGVSVNFAIQSVPNGATGQSLSTANTTTDTDGVANSTLTLGNRVGPYIVHATSAGLSGSPVEFTATATTGPAANITLISGNNQTKPINSPLDNPFVVWVTDVGGNPVQGVSVNFSIQNVPNGATGQSLSTTNTSTDAQGEASSLLTLGNKIGEYTVHATSSGLTGSPLTITATATVGSPAKVVLTIEPGEYIVGTDITLNALITDAGDNPVPNTGVVFGIVEGNGTFNGNTQRTTNEFGVATIEYTLHTIMEIAVLMAALSANENIYDMREVISVPDVANRLEFTEQPSNTTAGVAFSPPLQVTAYDIYGNRATSFTGQVVLTFENNPGNGTLSGTTTKQAQSGRVNFDNISIDKVGQGYRLRATASGVTAGISNAFNISAAAPAIMFSISGDGQSGFVNMPLEEPFVVMVTDAFENPVSNVVVSFEITDFPEGATGHSLSDETVITDANGEASTYLTLGNINEPHEVTASASGTNSVIFTTAAAGTHRIAGRITEGEQGLSGVNVTISWNNISQSGFTNINGNYNIFGIPHGAINIKVTPSRQGYAFIPTDTTIAGPLTENITDINFITAPPPVPALLSPANNSIDLPVSLVLTWQETERATAYSVQVAQSSDFTSGIIVNESGITNTELSVDNLEYGTTYYWRVNASNPSGASNWSEIRNFTVVSTSIHIIELRAGWNLVSSYIEPLDSSIESLFEPVLDNLIIVKDGDGNTFVPLFGIDDIENWRYSNGYQIYLDPQANALTLFGIKVKPETIPISLKAGWNMVGYLRSGPLNAVSALESIGSTLIIAKNGAGEVYIPPGVIGDDLINTMGDMLPGEGYQLFLSDLADLVYPGNTIGESPVADAGAASVRESGFIRREPTHYVVGTQTGSNATLIVRSEELRAGDEVAVWSESGVLVGGAAVYADGQAVVSVWGDNIYDEESVNGALDRERLSLTMWSAQDKRERELELLSVTDIATGTDGTELLFTRDAIWLGTVNVVREIPDEFVLHQNFPNPFNPSTTIRYGITTDAHVLLEVYNILGQRVSTLVDEERAAGVHDVVFDGSQHSSGTYFYRLQTGSFIEIKKLILLK